MGSPDEPVLGPPPVLMTLEGLNYLVAALLRGREPPAR